MTDREKELLKALKAAVFALNWIPNQSIRHPDYKNTYEVVSAIEKVIAPLMEEERKSSGGQSCKVCGVAVAAK